MMLLIKKDFFPGEVCPLYFFEKYRFSKSEHVHRKVKCAHLVPEPVVGGVDTWCQGQKKSTQKNSETKMHRQMHCTDVVPELAGRRSISLVARSKKLKLSSPQASHARLPSDRLINQSRADNALVIGIAPNSSNLAG